MAVNINQELRNTGAKLMIPLQDTRKICRTQSLYGSGEGILASLYKTRFSCRAYILSLYDMSQ